MRVACLTALLATLAMPVMAQDSPYGEYQDFVPGPDFSTTTEGGPPPTEMVSRLFALAFAEPCAWGLAGDPSLLVPQTYDFTFRYEYDEADAPDRTQRLYRLFCGAGAYNVQSVYMSWDSDNGLRTLSFAQPTFTATYADPDNSESAVTALALTGQSASSILVNSAVDPASGTISAQSCWRGLCDASSTGIWVRDGAEYRLQRYLVDPTYDGEMNPIGVVDNTAPVDLPLDVVDVPDLPMPDEF